MFWGESENAFFAYQEVDSQRKILVPVYPKPYYELWGDPKFKYISKRSGEIRLLAVDVATQGGSKNDATAITLLQMLPSSSGQYLRNVSYMETLEGGHGQDQAIRVRQLYDDLDVDYVILDCNGVGMTVADSLSQDQFDPHRNVTYEAWSFINDPGMAARSRNPDAPKVIYSIKATQQFNSDNAVALRDHMRRGKLRFLIDETEGINWLETSKLYNKMSVDDQAILEAPFYQISAFVNEIVNLDYEIVNGKIRVKEHSGARKDRYSSVAYANYIASEIERERKHIEQEDPKILLLSCVSSIDF